MRNFLLIISVIALGVLLSAAATAQQRRQIPTYQLLGAPVQPEIIQELDQFLADYASAWAEQDAEKLALLHSQDSEWINAYARIFRGRVALKSFLADKLFPAFPASVARAEIAGLKQVSTRVINQSVVVLHLYTDSDRGMSRNSDETLRRTHFHLVLSKADGRWLIDHTVIMDAR